MDAENVSLLCCQTEESILTAMILDSSKEEMGDFANLLYSGPANMITQI